MKIGFDFGTTYSKISYLAGSNLQEFPYPAMNGVPYIATAVAYSQISGRETCVAGRSARTAAIHSADAVFCENFKMLLPVAEHERWLEAGWHTEKTPAAATADYFRCLLLDGPDSFRAAKGTVDGLVVSIPEAWRQRINDHPGAEVLREILVQQMGLPVESLQSEPVCAAAYYSRLYQQSEGTQRRGRSFHGNLLICDMGGGTFDVALCGVADTEITVLDCDGNAEPGLGRAGLCFDHRAVERAHDALNTPPPRPGTPAHYHVLRAFEDAKIDLHAYTCSMFELYADKPGLLSDTRLYEILGQYQLTYAQVEEAFEPIGVGITDVLTRVKQRAANQHRNIDRIAIVGGFGLFPLVQRAVLKELGIGEDDERYDRLISNVTHREFAVSRGAALIANDMVQVVQHFPHAIGLELRTRKGSGPVEIMTIFPAGSVRAGQLQPAFFHDQDTTLTITPAFDGRLPLFIKPGGQGKWIGAGVPRVEVPPPGEYLIGILVDNSNLGTLVLKPKSRKGEIRYQLGKLEYSHVLAEGA